MRRARAEDLATCRALLEAALDELRPARGGRLLTAAPVGTPSPLERLETLPEDTTELLLVAATEGVVTGCCLTHVQTRGRADDAVGVAVVEVLFVAPPFRRAGLGSALLAAVIAWAAERGCAGVDVPVLPGAREAKQVFEGSGFTARLLVMHRAL